MSTTRNDQPARTLADQLRGWSDAQVAALLRGRPDLLTPAPHDSAQLASRAATRSSVLRALDSLSRLELCVLDALVVAGQTTEDQIVSIVHAEAGAVRAALRRLLDLALAWRAPEGLRALSGVADALRGDESAGVSGLRPVGPRPLPAEEIERRLATVSAAARALAEHLADRGGEGRTSSADRVVAPEDATTPVEELLAHGLLAPKAGATVVLPGEVGLALRGGRTTRTRVDDVPAVLTVERDAVLVERSAAGAAFEACRRVELLLDHWGTTPPPVLRNGGLGVRDLRAVTALLGCDEATAALLVEVAAGADLLAEGTTPDGEPAWLPTDAFDRWAGEDTATRWAQLVDAWLDSPRTPSLVGSRDAQGRGRNALAAELSDGVAAEARRMALAELAALPAGQSLATGTGVPSLVARVGWLRPRRPPQRDALVAAAVEEGSVLGVVGAGAVPPAGRALLDEGPAAAAAALAPSLPQVVDHVLLQADLTAVAPGPLEAELARRLHLVADVESRGGATVYRFTPASVRRAFDAGWTSHEVHDFVSSVSRTPVPQPLDYLVDDVARTFGTLRVGVAESFVRADDEDALTELLHHPGAASLGLRRLAPTVIVSPTPLDVLLPRLREMGAAPVVEAPDGTVQVARRDLLRARRRRRGAPTARAVEEARREAVVSSVVGAVRAGDRAAADRPAVPAARTNPAGALAALREAVEARTTVVIGYVDSHGTAGERVVDPRRIEGGTLTAYDHRSDDLRTFAVHRITGVRPASS